MKFTSTKYFLIFCCAVLFNTCSDPSSPVEVASREEIIEALNEDLQIFPTLSIPQYVIDSLLSYKAVIFGEFHTVGEERETGGELTVKLNEAGIYTEVCAECPDAYSWIFEKISTGEMQALPDWLIYNNVIPILDSIVNYNSKYGKEAKLKCIDANLEPDFFPDSFREFAEFTENNKLLEYFNQLIDDQSKEYIEKIEELKQKLESNPEELSLTDNNEQKNLAIRITDNELKSIPIRDNWETNYEWSFNERESFIKANADYHLSTNEGIALFYFGLYHAQKKRFMGSNIEWLGDYLHHNSPYTAGKAISIVGVPIRGTAAFSGGEGTTPFDLTVYSNPDDLFRIVGETIGENRAWLPLNSNLFKEQNVRVRYILSGSEVTAPPKEQFDAFIFFPEGTYVGW